MQEPVARRTIFTGLRTAARELWGDEGLQQCAERLSTEARARCITPLAIGEEWLPERFVLEWYLAAWEGPANRTRQTYNQWLQRMMDFGFGRVRKILVGFASPQRIVEQAAVLWRHDHSSGSMTSHITSATTSTVTLCEHVYVDTPLARASIAEIIRYAVALSRSVEVESTHTLDGPRTLAVHLSWRSRKTSTPTSLER